MVAKKLNWVKHMKDSQAIQAVARGLAGGFQKDAVQ
jgi:hypothetical protein